MKTFHYFKRTTLIVLLIIVVLGISIETVRSDFLFKLTKNNNVAPVEAAALPNALDQKEFNELDNENFLILIDPEEETSLKLAENITYTINYMKKKPQQLEAKQFDGNAQSFETIIIAFQDLSKIKNMEALVTYVHNGGRVSWPKVLWLTIASI